MSPTVENTRPAPSRAARRVGPWLLWFAALGGVLAWAVHLFVVSAVVELACLRGHDSVLGLSLRGLVALGTVLPLVLGLAATGVAWRLRRRIARTSDDDRRLQRAGFVAYVGLALNLLAVAMIVFGGVALLVLEPCVT